MANCDTCSSKPNCNKTTCTKIEPKSGNIKKVIGVISGKGGVGKSTVTGIIAIELAKAGYKVGVLDGDITGPSMPRFFGINTQRAATTEVPGSDEVRFVPVETQLGIKVISLNLLTEIEEQPVIWRGPVITGVLNQMFTDTAWGELDYLLIDMPPGTGDVALTIMQSFPVDSMIMVATPQDMVTMIVKKAVIMAEKLNMKVLGVVENMSYIQCGNCGEKQRVFNRRSAEEQAEILGLPLLAEMPIDLDFAEALEEGRAEAYIEHSSQYKGILERLV